jgi:hypothetical protein
MRPTHIPPLSACQAVEAAIQAFRRRTPLIFHDCPSTLSPHDEVYDGPSDPWWIALHANLYTAEMLMYKELAHHEQRAYDTAVSCARAFVKLIARVPPEQWAYVGKWLSCVPIATLVKLGESSLTIDMVVALDLSLVARFLNKESQRLAASGQAAAANMAAEEAEMLRLVLARDQAKYLPMSNLHALIVQRVQEGWTEKEGEYERV